MIGTFRLRGCTCKKKRCTCGAKWYFRYDIGPDPKTGKRRQREIGGFRTKTEAEAAAKKILVDMETGTYVEKKNILFKGAAEEWFDLYKSSGKVKVSTVYVRANEVAKLNEYFGHVKMKDISRKMYQDMLLDLHKRGKVVSTISGIHGTARMIFKRAMSLNYVNVDPTLYAELPKKQTTVEEVERGDIPRYLEKEELVKFLIAAKTQGLCRDSAIFTTLAYTGMRIGELCALKWKDIDFDNASISITKTLHNPLGGAKTYQIITPKTKRSIRTIEVDDLVLEELRLLRQVQDEFKDKNRSRYHDEGFVLGRMTTKCPGFPETLGTINVRMARLLKLTGLNQSLTPHSLRHTHASLLSEAGAKLEEIMDRLGHEDDSVTKKIYLHVTKAMKKEAANKFSDLMKRASVGKMWEEQ